MTKGWGYGKRTLSASEKLYNGFTKTFETEDMTVYKANLLYNGDMILTYIINHKNNTKTIVIKYEGNHRAKNYDITNCKNKKEVCNYIQNNLLYNYYMQDGLNQ